MAIVFLYLGCLCFGYFVGSRLRFAADRFSFVQGLLMLIVYVLVLIMGLRMGINEQVTSNLGTIGVKSSIMTVICIAGSMLTIFGARKLVGLDRYGDLVARGRSSCKDQSSYKGQSSGSLDDAERHSDEIKRVETETSEEGFSFKSTIIILAMVAVGMALGWFVLAQYFQDFLPQFNEITGRMLTYMLCLMLFLVGLDLGLAGKVVESIKSAGARVMIFPFAAIGGSLLFGAAAAVIMGFSLKEGLAISAGFGWYTYAPTVIADAGVQYMVASAVSFMHNVLREVAGIILIPVLAKKFGYIEACGVVGVAAMDVTLPIVERACRQDTIVYSIAIGIAMNIGTSVMVPLFMSL